MTRPVARLGDLTIGDCKKHGPNIKGKIVTATASVQANSRPVAKIGDIVLANCGCKSPIITGKGNTAISDSPIARIGDLVGGARQSGTGINANSPDLNSYKGKIISGSGDVFV